MIEGWALVFCDIDQSFANDTCTCLIGLVRDDFWTDEERLVFVVRNIVYWPHFECVLGYLAISAIAV